MTSRGAHATIKWMLSDGLMRTVLEQCAEPWSRTLAARFDPECVIRQLIQATGDPRDVVTRDLEAWLGRAGGSVDQVKEEGEAVFALFIPRDWLAGD
jgi:hypothetical protein